jgi:hypothetical protein
MLNETVIALEDIPFYCKKGKEYPLEDIYTGGTYLQYLVRGNYENHHKIARYFDAKLFKRVPKVDKVEAKTKDELNEGFITFENDFN